MREHWDNWGWIGGAAIIVIGVLPIIYGRENFCAGADEHCFREWLSALGAWLTLPALAFLGWQIHRSDVHHRNSILLEHEKKYEIAGAVADVCRACDSVIGVFLEATKEKDYTVFLKETRHLQPMVTAYASAIFRDFDENFTYRSSVLSGSLPELTTGLVFDGRYYVGDKRREITKKLLELQKFNRDHIAAAQSYIDRFNKILNA